MTGRVEGDTVEAISLYEEGQDTYPRLLAAFDGEPRFARAGIDLAALARELSS